MGVSPYHIAVGYQNKDLPIAGYNFACPSFFDVGSSKTVDLQNIKLINAVGDMSEVIYVYDENAVFQGEQYFWLSELNGAPEGDGWYNGEWVKIVKNFPQGTGIYLNCATEGAYLAYSGEVDTSAQEHDLQIIGYNIIGNPTPVDVDIQDIKLIGAVGDMSEVIYVYDENAVFQGEQYFWLSELNGAPEGDGWYNGEWGKIVKTVKAGEGLYLNCPTPDVTWTVPSPIKPATAD